MDRFIQEFELAWEQSRLLRWTVLALLIGMLFAAAGAANAVEPGWYAPDDNGEGLIVRCGSGGCTGRVARRGSPGPLLQNAGHFPTKTEE